MLQYNNSTYQALPTCNTLIVLQYKILSLINLPPIAIQLKPCNTIWAVAQFISCINFFFRFSPFFFSHFLPLENTKHFLYTYYFFFILQKYPNKFIRIYFFSIFFSFPIGKTLENNFLHLLTNLIYEIYFLYFLFPVFHCKRKNFLHLIYIYIHLILENGPEFPQSLLI